jgi:hypothetical protein
VGSAPFSKGGIRKDRSDLNDFRSGRVEEKAYFESVYGVDPMGIG